MVTPAECLQYAFSRPASVVMKNFKPLTSAQIAALGDKAKQAAMSGKYELYKTTSHFDTTAKNPSWLG